LGTPSATPKRKPPAGIRAIKSYAVTSVQSGSRTDSSRRAVICPFFGTHRRRETKPKRASGLPDQPIEPRNRADRIVNNEFVALDSHRHLQSVPRPRNRRAVLEGKTESSGRP